jgi:hypothetical protein
MTSDQKVFSYDWWVNVFASVVLVFLWRGSAWAAVHWHLTNSSEDVVFLWIVATYCALHAGSKRSKT